MIRHDFSVNIGCACSEQGPRIKCHDSGVTLALHLKVPVKPSEWRTVYEDYSIPEGTTAVIRVKKPDNKVVLTDKGITFEGGSVVVCSELEQAYTAPGICNAELSLYNPDGKRLTSATFTYEVEKECVCDEDERSEDYMNVLGGIVKEVNEAVDSAQSYAAEAEEWAKKAQASGGGTIIDSLTADKVTFTDGETFQQKYDSGELTGAPGEPGEPGAPGAPGAPGYTPVKGVDYFDGQPGYTPVKGVDYFDGQPGYTPVKGVDYFDGEPGKDGITPHIGTNKNWFIGDTDTGIRAEGKDGQNGVGGGGCCAYVYSTEETVVGTWVDGKPIYQITMSGLLPASASESYKLTDLGYVERLVDCQGWVKENNYQSTLPRYFGSGYYIDFNIPNNTHDVYLRLKGHVNQEFAVTFEYTKTTDTATIEIPSAMSLRDAYDEGVQNA